MTSQYNASVSEDQPVGWEVIRVEAYSNDVGENARLRYSISGGNEKAKFAIDETTGWFSM